MKWVENIQKARVVVEMTRGRFKALSNCSFHQLPTNHCLIWGLAEDWGLWTWGLRAVSQSRAKVNMSKCSKAIHILHLRYPSPDHMLSGHPSTQQCKRTMTFIYKCRTDMCKHKTNISVMWAKLLVQVASNELYCYCNNVMYIFQSDPQATHTHKQQNTNTAIIFMQ